MPAWHNSSFQKILNWFERRYWCPFPIWNLHCSCTAINSSSHPACVWLCVKGAKNVFLNQTGVLGPLETYSTPNEMYRTILLSDFCHHLHQLFRRILRWFSAAKLQKCFRDCETSSDLPSAWGWLDDDWLFLFGWTYPLMARRESDINPLM